MADPHTALTTTGAMDVVVVTPTGEVAHRGVDGVTAHGAKGEFTILPGHIPYLTMLETGVLILEGRGGRQVWAHGPGYLEVGANGRIEVLVEQAREAGKVDPDAVHTELAEAESELKQLDSTEGAEWKSLDARRAWAMAQLDARRRSAN